MEVLEDPSPQDNTPEFSVAELTGAVRRTLEGAFGRVRVRGEVGRVFRARSGHLYYDLKDDRNVIACITWKGQVANLEVDPEEGLEVIVEGRLTAGIHSKYQINVDRIEVAGRGALLAMLEKRKAQLATEGLFADARKKPLPYLPAVIGVVTSPSGAVIRDILHRLQERLPRQVLVWPVAVQGAQCAPEVARAIHGFNALEKGGDIPRPDLIIVARGGGSVEDLWGFNEEIIVRAVAASTIPLISAVGHETDTTLIDLAADKRAPTPTAAAEIAVPVRLELMARIQERAARLRRAQVSAMQYRQQRLADLARAMPKPEGIYTAARQRLDYWDQRLGNALDAPLRKKQLALVKLAGRLAPSTLSARMTRQRERTNEMGRRLAQSQETRLAQYRTKLANLERLQETLSYRATLNRGYAVVRAQGTLITSASDAKPAPQLDIEFADGQITVHPTAGTIKPKTTAKKKRKKRDPRQGRLL